MSQTIKLDVIQEQDNLKELITYALQIATKNGATSASVGASLHSGLSVKVRSGGVDTVSFSRDRGFGITVYHDFSKGSASTSDISKQAIEATVQAACGIAKFTASDKHSGLAEKKYLADKVVDLDLYHPWELDSKAAIDLSIECESMATSYDSRIINSEGVCVDINQSVRVYGNSHGFLKGYPSSSSCISCFLIAKDNMGMQRDGWYSVARDHQDLQDIKDLAKISAKRTVSKLGARKINTCKVPVLFTPEVARGLLYSFISAISGGSLYRKASFLLDKLGTQVFSKLIRLTEDPYLKKGLGSAYFDNEGVATNSRDVVKDGVLQGYVLSSYSARRLGMQTTGNAGGVHNLTLEGGKQSFIDLVKTMRNGLIVTELMGQGINIITGDYSRGATGFWVEDSEIAFPVEEVTIAGNLKDMFLNIIGVGDDLDYRGNIITGSLLIEQMTVAGD